MGWEQHAHAPLPADMLLAVNTVLQPAGAVLACGALRHALAVLALLVILAANAVAQGCEGSRQQASEGQRVGGMAASLRPCSKGLCC